MKLRKWKSKLTAKHCTYGSSALPNHVQTCQKPVITVLSHLSLMTPETFAILTEMHHPFPHPWTHQQSKGLEHSVKQYPVKMCQSNSGCQITSSNSVPISIVTTSTSHFQWTPPIIHRRKWKKKTPDEAAPYETNQPKVKKRYYLKRSALSLGRKAHPFAFLCSQQPSIAFLRGSTREPSPASIAQQCDSKKRAMQLLSALITRSDSD